MLNLGGKIGKSPLKKNLNLMPIYIQQNTENSWKDQIKWLISPVIDDQFFKTVNIKFAIQLFINYDFANVTY
jgi:hypothetical protein